MLNHPDLKSPEETNEEPGSEIISKKIRNVDSFQILESNPEATSQDQDSKEGFQAPKFSYILPTRRRHILVLDVSQAMNIEDERQWEMARNALFRFINHVPEGDEVGIISFGANARINIEPTEVTSSNREGLYGRVPFRLLRGQQGCLDCGLKMAIDMLEKPRSISNGNIIVLTATQGSQSTQFEGLKARIEARAWPLYLVAFEPHLHPAVVQLSAYGGAFSVNQDGFLQQNLADAFTSILNKGRDLNMRIEKSYYKSFNLDSNQGQEVATSAGKRGIAISGNFIVEDNLRSNVWVILTSPYKEDVELFEITSPSGQRKVFPKFENGIVYFYMEGLSEPGIWSYKASLYPFANGGSDLKSNQVSVEVIAQPTSVNEDTIKVESWTNVEVSKGANALDKPVLIYAKVTKGQDLPVLNAKVTAKVMRPDSSVPYELILTDFGTGYPDLTNGDGIYSAYFTGFTASNGLYSLEINVNHNEGRASTPSLLNLNEDLECCGSTLIPAGLVYTTPTSQFSRFINSPSFYVNQGLPYIQINGQTELEKDIFPPSRVSDLKVLSFVNNTLYATLQWSAPGSDFDQNGPASSYEIRCYTNAQALSDINFANMGIPVHESLLPTPGHSGQVQTATVSLPWANEVFYYGLVSLDASGNRSPVSNLVPVYATEISTEDSNDFDLGSNQVDGVLINNSFALSSVIQDTFGSNENLIYILVGGICGIVFIISLICIAVFCRAKHLKKEEKRKQNARTQIFVNDLEANSSNSVLPDLALPQEKPQNYSQVWATHASGLPNGGNSSPTNSSLEEYANMYMNRSNNYHMNTTHQAQSAMYHVPVHEYRPPTTEHIMPNQAHHYGPNEESVEGLTPTYQNWNNKPPSDNGTATTSSTECYDDHHSDHSKVIANNNNNNSASTVRVAPLRRYSVDDYIGGSNQGPNGLSLSPSFCSASEKRRRQESLV